MTSLPGYDAWKTREPEEPRYDPAIVYLVHRYSPHMARGVEDGPYDRREDAEAAAQRWLAEMAASDPKFAEDYWHEIIERDELADCTCTNRRVDEWCVVHGRDPDAEYERLRDDGRI
jgi:hypothetical protein